MSLIEYKSSMCGMVRRCWIEENKTETEKSLEVPNLPGETSVYVIYPWFMYTRRHAYLRYTWRRRNHPYVSWTWSRHVDSTLNLYIRNHYVFKHFKNKRKTIISHGSVFRRYDICSIFICSMVICSSSICSIRHLFYTSFALYSICSMIKHVICSIT